jgi:hypothetical protein
MPVINEVSLQRFPYVLAKLQQALDRTAAEHSKRVSYFQGEPVRYSPAISQNSQAVSPLRGRTIYSAEIEADLRAVF